jgi:NAD(P)-dependent dehydrogenase (short-subunit alcohol dehydrogenase family)
MSSHAWPKGSSQTQRIRIVSNPVILITGALTGRATAVAFAKEGACVVVSGRRQAEGEALEAELRGLGAGAEFILADVRREQDVRGLVDQSVAHFGRIDTAINTPAPKVGPAQSPSGLPRAMRPPLTPMCLARCSA